MKLNSGNVNIDNICIIIYSTSNSIRKLLLPHVNMKTEIFAFAGHENVNPAEIIIIIIRLIRGDNEPRNVSVMLQTPAVHL